MAATLCIGHACGVSTPGDASSPRDAARLQRDGLAPTPLRDAAPEVRDGVAPASPDAALPATLDADLPAGPDGALPAGPDADLPAGPDAAISDAAIADGAAPHGPEAGNADAAVPADASVAVLPDMAAGCLPAPEVCNGRDDDCDGRVDDLPHPAAAVRWIPGLTYALLPDGVAYLESGDRGSLILHVTDRAFVDRVPPVEVAPQAGTPAIALSGDTLGIVFGRVEAGRIDIYVARHDAATGAARGLPTAIHDANPLFGQQVGHGGTLSPMPRDGFLYHLIVDPAIGAITPEGRYVTSQFWQPVSFVRSWVGFPGSATVAFRYEMDPHAPIYFARLDSFGRFLGTPARIGIVLGSMAAARLGSVVQIDGLEFQRVGPLGLPFGPSRIWHDRILGAANLTPAPWGYVQVGPHNDGGPFSHALAALSADGRPLRPPVNLDERLLGADIHIIEGLAFGDDLALLVSRGLPAVAYGLVDGPFDCGGQTLRLLEAGEPCHPDDALAECTAPLLCLEAQCRETGGPTLHEAVAERGAAPFHGRISLLADDPEGDVQLARVQPVDAAGGALGPARVLPSIEVVGVDEGGMRLAVAIDEPWPEGTVRVEVQLEDTVGHSTNWMRIPLPIEGDTGNPTRLVTPGTDHGAQLATAPGGGVFAFFASDGIGPGEQCVLTRVGLDGAPHWSVALAGGEGCVAHGVASDPAGGAYVGGLRLGADGAAFVARIDGDGRMLWSIGLGSDDPVREAELDAIVPFEGGVFVLGAFGAPALDAPQPCFPGHRNVLLLDGDGRLVAETRLDIPFADNRFIAGRMVGPDRMRAVITTQPDPTFVVDIRVVRSPEGVELTLDRQQGVMGAHAVDADIDAQGRVAIVDDVRNVPGDNAHVLLLDEALQLRWSVALHALVSLQPTAVHLLRDGGVALAGVYTPERAATDGFVARLDEGGLLQMAWRYGTPAPDGLRSMAADAVNGVWLAGDAFVGVDTGSDVLLLRTTVTVDPVDCDNDLFQAADLALRLGNEPRGLPPPLYASCEGQTVPFPDPVVAEPAGVMGAPVCGP